MNLPIIAFERAKQINKDRSFARSNANTGSYLRNLTPVFENIVVLIKFFAI
jgi:hypothetical protein